MEGGTGSGGVERGSGSGSLVLKKENGMAEGGGGGLETGKEKKRRREGLSDLESSEELEEDDGRKLESRRSDFFGRRNGFHTIYRRKKSKLDVFEFDEYDNFYEDLIAKKDCGINGEDSPRPDKKFLSPCNTVQTESAAGASRGGGDIVYIRRKSFKGASSSSSNVRDRMTRQSLNASRLSASFNFKKSGALVNSVRVQGKNDVLMVRVDKEQRSGLLKKCTPESQENLCLGAGVGITIGELSACSSKMSEARPDERVATVGRTGKVFQNLHKSMSTKTSEPRDSGSDDSDTSLKAGRDTDSCKTVDRKRGKEIIIPAARSTPAISKSRRRSGGTEKQKLREYIKKMLLDAGWTIEYKLRRNRNYNDAVYVSTSGTAYWSIIKAYDVFQKEIAVESKSITSVDESLYTPLPDTDLSKLTRNKKRKKDKDRKVKHQKSGASGCSKRASARMSLKVKYESDETSEEEEEEDFSEEEAEEEEPWAFKKEGGKSLKVRNHQLSRQLPLQGGKGRKFGRCTLKVRSTNKGLNPSDGYVPYMGKCTLLSWLIDCGTVKLSEKVQYVNRSGKRTLRQGLIARDGIHCACCNKVVTIVKFEIHAGSKLQQPFQNVITESGASLLQCLLEAWNKQAVSASDYFHNVDVDGDDPNDDTCSVCGDGGDLICCDGCPSTYHQSCLGVEVLPAGDWLCPNCVCICCGASDRTDAKSDTVKALLACSVCEKKYHFSCLKDADCFTDDASGSHFCGVECKQLYMKLQKSLGIRHELEAGFSWSVIRRTVLDSSCVDKVSPLKVECNAKLAVAQTIMDECFLPIIDQRSQVNRIHNVLYNCGSNINRLNYTSFYTAILEKGDEIISAASLRFHGTKFAEMPFIGTRHIYRRQGMCRRLLSAIEHALHSFKVEKLIIPAISELLHTWTGVFGFQHIEQSGKKKLRHMNVMAFPGVDMLQKALENEKLEQEAIVDIGLRDTNTVSPDTCQDPSVIADDLSISDGSLDGRHTSPGPVIRSAECLSVSCLPDQFAETHVDDSTVTEDKCSAPGLNEPPGSPDRIGLLDPEDETLLSGNKLDEIKSETDVELKCSGTTYCDTDLIIEEKHVSESAGKNDRYLEDSDKSDVPVTNGVHCTKPAAPVDSVKPVSNDCHSKSFPAAGQAIPLTSIDKGCNGRQYTEKFVALDSEEKSMVATKITVACQQGDQLPCDECLADTSADAAQSNTQAGDVSNGDVIMGDVEIQRRLNGEPNIQSSDATTSSPLSLKVPSQVRTPDAIMTLAAPDQDVEMPGVPGATAITTSVETSEQKQQAASNRLALRNGTEPLIALKVVSDAVVSLLTGKESEHQAHIESS